MSNLSLNRAQYVKNDEFYTRYVDIEKELAQYDADHFKDKIVYCNCDDPRWSNFVKYFILNFNRLGLKKLISTHYILPGSGESKTFAITITEVGPDARAEYDDLIKELRKI